MLIEEQNIPAAERRLASDFAQFVNSFSRPSTNFSRQFLRIVISFSSLSLCSTCGLKNSQGIYSSAPNTDIEKHQ
jgi:hypothetical protein